MNRLLAAGAVCTAVGAAGYALGTVVAYPGRALSVTAVMVGVTLIAIRRANEEASS